jgi:H+/Cl- antiporter ClcA
MEDNTLTPTGTEGRQARDSTTERAVDRAILTNIFAAAITGAIAYVAAIMATTVEEWNGFWRYVWLGICIVTFLYAFVSVILAVTRFDVHEKQ